MDLVTGAVVFMGRCDGFYGAVQWFLWGGAIVFMGRCGGLYAEVSDFLWKGAKRL